ncbi:MAG: GTPase Era, partial [Betaproteobacteria bacterium]|nr:GTPase Era [Betaproteobacteria bacterium]
MHRCGSVAIVGRPNVGKSTLLNRLVGQKLSITSDRPQTTRHRIVGVLSRDDAQLLFLDSPGFQTRVGGALNRVLNRTALQVAEDADVTLLVCDAQAWTPADEAFARRLTRARPRLLVLNKIDQVPDKSRLLPMVQKLQGEYGFDEIIPVSARTGRQIDTLIGLCVQRLPEGPPLFETDALTDRSERFLAAEMIREKLFRQLG